MLYMFLAIFLAVILLLLFAPLTIVIKIEENGIYVFAVVYKVIKIHLIDKTKIKKIEKKIDIRILAEFIIEFIREMMPYIMKFISKTSMEVYFYFKFGVTSPHRTAILYGVLNSFIYSLENILREFLKKYHGKYVIHPDLNNTVLNYDIEIRASVRIPSLLKLSFKALKFLIKHKAYYKREGGASNARAYNRRANENYNG